MGKCPLLKKWAVGSATIFSMVCPKIGTAADAT
jgi:hypothetical protein